MDRDLGCEGMVRALDGEVGAALRLWQGEDEAGGGDVADHAQVKEAVLRIGVGRKHKAAALEALEHHGRKEGAVHVVDCGAVVHRDGAGGLFLREEDL